MLIKRYYLSTKDPSKLVGLGIEIVNQSSTYYEVKIQLDSNAIASAKKSLNGEEDLSIEDLLYGIGCSWIYPVPRSDRQQFIIPDDYDSLVELKAFLNVRLSFLLQDADRSRKNRLKSSLDIAPINNNIRSVKAKLKAINMAINKQDFARHRENKIEKAKRQAEERRRSHVNAVMENLAQAKFPKDDWEQKLWLLDRWKDTLSLLHNAVGGYRQVSEEDIDRLRRDYANVRKHLKLTHAKRR